MKVCGTVSLSSVINPILMLMHCPTTVMVVHREAANNGHGHGAYNLVAGHLQGYDTDVEEQ